MEKLFPQGRVFVGLGCQNMIHEQNHTLITILDPDLGLQRQNMIHGTETHPDHDFGPRFGLGLQCQNMIR